MVLSRPKRHERTRLRVSLRLRAGITRPAPPDAESCPAGAYPARCSPGPLSDSGRPPASDPRLRPRRPPVPLPSRPAEPRWRSTVSRVSYRVRGAAGGAQRPSLDTSLLVRSAVEARRGLGGRASRATRIGPPAVVTFLSPDDRRGYRGRGAGGSSLGECWGVWELNEVSDGWARPVAVVLERHERRLSCWSLTPGFLTTSGLPPLRCTDPSHLDTGHDRRGPGPPPQVEEDVRPLRDGRFERRGKVRATPSSRAAGVSQRGRPLTLAPVL